MLPLPDPHTSSPEPAGRSLQIRVARHRNSVDVTLAGELDLASTEELDAAIRDAEETSGPIVVDLSAVSFVDSSGLSTLLNAKRRNDGRLSCVPSRHQAVTRLLELTGTVEMLA